MQSPKSQRLTGEREIQLKRLLHGLAALPLLTGVALAETPKQSSDGKALAKHPMQLSEQQMDRVTAGFRFFEVDIFNTGSTIVSVYQPKGNIIVCADCYLLINTPSLSVASRFVQLNPQPLPP